MIKANIEEFEQLMALMNKEQECLGGTEFLMTSLKF